MSYSSSHGVLRPFDAWPERVYSTPACHTGYVPPAGFLTLSTGYSSLERPVLFHTGVVLGVLYTLQGVSLTTRSRWLVTCGITHLVFSPSSSMPFTEMKATS